MEERKLNEKESLELIAQMIQNTKNRLETNCGMPFDTGFGSMQQISAFYSFDGRILS